MLVKIINLRITDNFLIFIVKTEKIFLKLHVLILKVYK